MQMNLYTTLRFCLIICMFPGLHKNGRVKFAEGPTIIRWKGWLEMRMLAKCRHGTYWPQVVYTLYARAVCGNKYCFCCTPQYFAFRSIPESA